MSFGAVHPSSDSIRGSGIPGSNVFPCRSIQRIVGLDPLSGIADRLKRAVHTIVSAVVEVIIYPHVNRMILGGLIQRVPAFERRQAVGGALIVGQIENFLLESGIGARRRGDPATARIVPFQSN